jgi:hypothetical protein
MNPCIFNKCGKIIQSMGEGGQLKNTRRYPVINVLKCHAMETYGRMKE